VLLVIAFDVEALIGEALLATTLLFVTFGTSIAGFTYLVSFLFKSPATAQNAMLLLNLVLGFMLMMASFILQIIQSTRDIAGTLNMIFRIFPAFCLGNGLLSVSLREILSAFDDELERGEVRAPMDWECAGANITFMCVESVIYFLLVLAVEKGSQIPSLTQLFTKTGALPDADPNEDTDVAAERVRVDAAGSDADNVVMKSLCKKWGQATAVKKMSMSIPEGECFGLLGINGAGKTTCMGMLTCEFPPSGGEAFVGGKGILSQPAKVQQQIGYCPQFDALLDCLTGREHLQLYAKIKGVPARQIKQMVDAKIKELGLTELADRLASSYSGGNKRKLSVAIAMIGNPTVILMDEPSTGMDPFARRAMWDVISAATTRVVNGKKTSVILTTHSMEECEALCTRIGIMVSGELRCLGSAQHLKNRFGMGYQMEVGLTSPSESKLQEVLAKFPAGNNDMSDTEMTSALEAAGKGAWAEKVSKEGSGSLLWQSLQSNGLVAKRDVASWLTVEEMFETLNSFMSDQFPGMVCHEVFGVKARYEVPSADKSMGAMFGLIEKEKEALGIESYSLSQTSLEQVFNQFAAKQIQENAMRSSS